MLNLKKRRIELGLTMLDVAKKVGVSEATISRYESGNIKNMRRDRIDKYAKALNVSPSEFLETNEYVINNNQEDEKWRFIQEMSGEKSVKTVSDTGSLKIGTNDFTVLIPNGCGDGYTCYAILARSEFYADTIMKFFTIVNGKLSIFSYDCGNEVIEEINGKFSIYYYNGFVAFVREQA